MSLCKYKSIFGNPKEGIHSIRIFNIAIIDVLLTLLLAYAIHYSLVNFFYYKNVSIWLVIISCFILGILSHRVFCVRTTIDKLLFTN